MNSNERFGQIEAMLAEMLRRMDRQSEQIGDIINILKISDERQTRAEERQDRAEKRQDDMLADIRQLGARIDRQGDQIDRQGKRLEQQGGRLEQQGKQLDAMLQTHMQMLNLLTRNAERTDRLEQRFPVDFEDRVKRLEDAVFNKAS